MIARKIPATLCAALLATPAAAALTAWTPLVAPSALEGDVGAPAIEWQVAIGGPGDEYAYDVWPAADGGYVVVGRTSDVPGGNVDAFVMKLGEDGALVWARRWGGAAVDIAFAVRTLQDGAIAVAGWTRSFGAGEGDFFLLGLEPTGELRFERTFGGAKDDRATHLAATRDGGLALFGESYSEGDDAQFYLVKTDAQGEPQWERRYDGGPLNDRGLAVLEHDDGYLLVGNSMDSTSGSTATLSDGFVVATDAEGAELWRRTFGGEAHDILHHAAQMRDGRFLLTGYTRGFGANGLNDLWVIGVDADGREHFAKLIGGPGADHNIVARPWGAGAALAGYTSSFGAGGWDAQVVRLGARGRLAWSHVYGGPSDDGATSLAPRRDGGLVVAGYTESFGAGGQDALVMKLAPKGKRS